MKLMYRIQYSVYNIQYSVTDNQPHAWKDKLQRWVFSVCGIIFPQFTISHTLSDAACLCTHATGSLRCYTGFYTRIHSIMSYFWFMIQSWWYNLKLFFPQNPHFTLVKTLNCCFHSITIDLNTLNSKVFLFSHKEDHI